VKKIPVIPSKDGAKISPWPHLRNAIAHYCDNARPHAIYSATEVDFSLAHERIAQIRRETRIAVSVHAFVLGCAAHAASALPMLSAFRVGKKLVCFESLDMGTVIDQHVSKTVRMRLPVVYIVRDAGRKSIAQINWEIRAAARTDLGQNPETAFRRRLTKTPAAVQKVMFRRIIRDPWLHRKFFGTMGFTSTQSPLYAHPLTGFVPNIHSATIAMGNIHQKFMPDENGAPVLRKMLDMTGTFDHDFVDGQLLSRFGFELSRLIENAHGLDEDFVAETNKFKANQSQ
jgi:pyruvate/2-oxoglutarate dehydrogenase complex dihydrolipoamide acyltransferase (E2) component